MTKDTITETAALKALLSETADHQVLAEMLGFVADRLMALDVDQVYGAEAHERSIKRVIPNLVENHGPGKHGI